MEDNRSPKGLYPDELTEFYQMYDSGKYHIKEIAEWFGISTTSVNRYIRKRDEYERKR